MDIAQAASAYNAIAGITQKPQPQGDDSSAAASESAGGSFSDMLSQALGTAAASGHKAEAMSKQAVAGKGDLTELVTAIGSAEQALSTVVTIRDKMISAYQQIMQMSI